MTCDRCGKKSLGVWVYSQATGHHYCRDFEACDKRKSARDRKAKAAA